MVEPATCRLRIIISSLGGIWPVSLWPKAATLPLCYTPLTCVVIYIFDFITLCLPSSYANPNKRNKKYGVTKLDQLFGAIEIWNLLYTLKWTSFDMFTSKEFKIKYRKDYFCGLAIHQRTKNIFLKFVYSSYEIRACWKCLHLRLGWHCRDCQNLGGSS